MLYVVNFSHLTGWSWESTIADYCWTRVFYRGVGPEGKRRLGVSRAVLRKKFRAGMTFGITNTKRSFLRKVMVADLEHGTVKLHGVTRGLLLLGGGRHSPDGRTGPTGGFQFVIIRVVVA